MVEVLKQKMMKAVSQKTTQQPALSQMSTQAPQNQQQTQCHTQASINQSQEKEPLYPRSTKSKAVMIDQRYEIRKKIDEGTYAKVYLA